MRSPLFWNKRVRMVRIVRLGEKTAFIDVNEWPAEGGCNLFLLTDRQLCILQSLVFPFVRWETRFVTPLGGTVSGCLGRAACGVGDRGGCTRNATVG